MEDMAAIREELDAAIERDDHGRAFALGLQYIGEAIEALGEALAPTRVEHVARVDPADAGGLGTLFDAFAASPMGKQAQSALGLAPLEPVPFGVVGDPETMPVDLTEDEEEAQAAAEARAEREDRDEQDAEEPLPDRHPQIPADAWAQLDGQQKREVDDLVERLLKAERAAIEARTPTDKDTYATAATNLAAELTDEWGIKLLDESAVDAEERAGLEGGEIPPPAHSRSTVGDLRRRARFLRSRTGLPPEAAQAREEELARIAGLLQARGDA